MGQQAGMALDKSELRDSAKHGVAHNWSTDEVVTVVVVSRHNNPMLLSVETPRPPRPTLPASGQHRPDLAAPENLLPGSKSAEPLGCVIAPRIAQQINPKVKVDEPAAERYQRPCV
jgi:hypothetical protein